MGFFQWLEATGLAEWVRSSLVGYPLVLTLHSIGMAIMVGLVFMLDLRLLGQFERIPYSALSKMLRLAWIGFAINVVSGAAIFTSQAASYVTNWPFLLKMAAVFSAAIIAAYMQPRLNREAAGWGSTGQVPGSMRGLAITSLALWIVAITTGRFTAYL
jgi:hypothetical protein